MPCSEWLSWSESRSGALGDLLSLGFIYLFLVAILGIPLSLLVCCIPRYQRKAGWLLLCSVVAVVCFGLGFHLSQPFRRQALQQVITRAESLIVAIRKFESEHGKPPPDLSALVPNHLAAVPTPGIHTSPEFFYRLPKPDESIDGNAWMLEVNPPIVGIGFDRFIYLPNQNYPERGWGGVLERIGTWAYVHE
ncbi:MAG: hypothetical protein RL514_3368 [Verrucomicrobiota bacterium]|jgi:hypothetical protein